MIRDWGRLIEQLLLRLKRIPPSNGGGWKFGFLGYIREFTYTSTTSEGNPSLSPVSLFLTGWVRWYYQFYIVVNEKSPQNLFLYSSTIWSGVRCQLLFNTLQGWGLSCEYYIYMYMYIMWNRVLLNILLKCYMYVFSNSQGARPPIMFYYALSPLFF